MEQVYLDNILDQFKHPRNYGEMKNPSIKHHDSNPLCGDEITIALRVRNNRIGDVRFLGHGCAISQAAASMLTEKIKGMDIEKAKQIKNEDVFEMLGIKLSPLRMKCALLGLQVLKAGIAKHKYGV